MEKITLELNWENSKSFSLTMKRDGTNITIVEVEENGCIASIWPDVQDICEVFFRTTVTTIGDEMKEE